MTLLSGIRPVGRPRGRWLDAVERDAEGMLKCRNWRGLAEIRDTKKWGLKTPLSKLAYSAKEE
jgi:hypothetical protein